MNRPSSSDMRCNPAIDPEESGIEHLLQRAAHYQRPGWINVAVSLRALAAKKKAKPAGESDDEKPA